MLEITSKKAVAKAPRRKVFDFLSDFNNFEQLLPQDKVEKWQCDGETCSFTIKGLSSIGMKLVDKSNEDKIAIISHGKNPFSFNLEIHLNEEGELQTTGYLVFKGDVNPFLKMMAEKPLTNFFNMLAEQLEQKFSS